jgi:hypothetical protein
MDATQSQIKIHRIPSAAAADFAFDYDTATDDLLTELVPNLDNWGGVGWMELTDCEYDVRSEILNLTVETKWSAPVEWLRNASIGTHYFENKLITMTTIQKDETCVTGVGVMDGEILQNKYIFEMELEEVQKYYNDDEPEYDVDKLDNQIWDSVGSFVGVCEQFYLGENHEA